MSALFAQLLFTALALAVPATLSVFIGEPGRPRLRGPYRALLAAGFVAGAALALGALAGAGAGRTGGVAGLLGVAVLAFGPVARPWTLRGLVAWSMTVTAGAAYLLDVLTWMGQAELGVASLLSGAALWLFEVFVSVLALGYLWELVDVRARWDWQRRTEVRRAIEVDPPPRAFDGRRPFVSLHVPTHNEPPDVVIATLEKLVALEYDDFEVLVVDNNTDDPELWRPVERFCRAHEKLGFFHLEDWPGHKAGALNHALDKVDPRTELVGVVDADYLVDPDFLSRCVPLFEEARLAFVQTPPDYRDWEVHPYFRRLYHSDAASFDVSQRSRNERNGPVLGGTMGLIRRDALLDVGGWDEWCITEDAELSLRLLQAGWSGTHVEHSFGRGIMPLTFEALKRQRFRWSFGGVQLLRLHWRALLPGPRTDGNALTLGQRWAYLVGGLQWFGDLVGLLLTAFLLVGAVDVLAGDGLVVRRFSAALLASVVALVLLGSLRSVALIRRTAPSSWRDSVGVLGLWLALGWVVGCASARGLVARQGAFLHTPQLRGDMTWRDSVRGNIVESLLALACVVGAVAGFVAAAAGTVGGAAVGVLLTLQAAGYAAAPLNSLAAVRADLTPELRRRRREGLLSWTRGTPGTGRWGIGPVVAAGVVTAAVLLVAGPVAAPQLDDLAGGDRSEPAAGPARQQPSEVPPPSQSALVAIPLSPLSSLLTPSPSAGTQPVVAGPTRAPGGSRPTRAATTPATLPTSQPTQATTAHGRPTWLPTKSTPTKGPH